MTILSVISIVTKKQVLQQRTFEIDVESTHSTEDQLNALQRLTECLMVMTYVQDRMAVRSRNMFLVGCDTDQQCSSTELLHHCPCTIK